jgi:hypothetical protein
LFSLKRKVRLDENKQVGIESLLALYTHWFTQSGEWEAVMILKAHIYAYL